MAVLLARAVVIFTLIVIHETRKNDVLLATKLF